MAARDGGHGGHGGTAHECSVAMLEIYNEKIHDLLDPGAKKAPAPRNLREDVGLGGSGGGGRGVYVEGLTNLLVGDAAAAVAALERGTSNRRVAATAMNAESSRSHSVFTITIKCTTIMGGALVPESDGLGSGSGSSSSSGGGGGGGDGGDGGDGGGDGDGLGIVRTSRLHLVDLAGSERQKLTNTAGAQLTEATNINKSLSALGNVILALTTKPTTTAGKGGAEKKSHIPYRDSKLTRLLQDSLGGTARTTVICAVASDGRWLGETVSTLKFAQRAKAIKNRVARAEETAVGTVPQLTREVERLRRLLGHSSAGQALEAADERAARLEAELAGARAENARLRAAMAQMADDAAAELAAALEAEMAAAAAAELAAAAAAEAALAAEAEPWQICAGSGLLRLASDDGSAVERSVERSGSGTDGFGYAFLSSIEVGGGAGEGEGGSPGMRRWVLRLGAGEYSLDNLLFGLTAAEHSAATTDNSLWQPAARSWLMDAYDGSLFGSGRCYADGAGGVPRGSEVLLELHEAKGTLSFIVDGVRHGPGHVGVSGKVKPCVVLGCKGQTVLMQGRGAGRKNGGGAEDEDEGWEDDEELWEDEEEEEEEEEEGGGEGEEQQICDGAAEQRGRKRLHGEIHAGCGETGAG